MFETLGIKARSLEEIPIKKKKKRKKKSLNRIAGNIWLIGKIYVIGGLKYFLNPVECCKQEKDVH